MPIIKIIAAAISASFNTRGDGGGSSRQRFGRPGLSRFSNAAIITSQCSFNAASASARFSHARPRASPSQRTLAACCIRFTAFGRWTHKAVRVMMELNESRRRDDQESKRRLQSAFRKRQKSRRSLQIKVTSRKAPAPGGIFQASERITAAKSRSSLFAAVFPGALRQHSRNIFDHGARRPLKNSSQCRVKLILKLF